MSHAESPVRELYVPAWHSWHVKAAVAPGSVPYFPLTQAMQVVAKEKGSIVMYMIEVVYVDGRDVTVQVFMFIFLTYVPVWVINIMFGSMVDAHMLLGIFSCAFVPIPSIDALTPVPTTVFTARVAMFIVLSTFVSV